MKLKIEKLLEWVLAVVLIVMVLDVLWGVFTRYVIGHQSSWTDELARFLLIWLGVLGSAYASGRDMHIAIDLLPHYLRFVKGVFNVLTFLHEEADRNISGNHGYRGFLRRGNRAADIRRVSPRAVEQQRRE